MWLGTSLVYEGQLKDPDTLSLDANLTPIASLRTQLMSEHDNQTAGTNINDKQSEPTYKSHHTKHHFDLSL